MLYSYLSHKSLKKKIQNLNVCELNADSSSLTSTFPSIYSSKVIYMDKIVGKHEHFDAFLS